jgi:hypothetical protein
MKERKKNIIKNGKINVGHRRKYARRSEDSGNEKGYLILHHKV